MDDNKGTGSAQYPDRSDEVGTQYPDSQPYFQSSGYGYGRSDYGQADQTPASSQSAQYGQSTQYGQGGEYPQTGRYQAFGQPQSGQSSQYDYGQSQPWAAVSGSGYPPQGPGGTSQTSTEPRRGKGIRAGTVALVTLLAAGVGGLSGWAVSSQTGATPAAIASASASSAPSATVTKVAQANASNPDWTATAKAVSDSVVSITVRTSQGTGAGSGVVLDAKGDIVTNNHVVSAGGGGGTISVGLGDKSYQASVVGTDASTDLAVIRLKQIPKELTQIDFADSDKLAVGAPVMAIGNPLGLSGSVTTGIISALNRPVTTSSSEQSSGSSDGVVVTSAIQTSAPINPGNSGGALVNAEGQLIGINSSIASLSSSSSGSQSGSIGIGFAIPANQVRNITDQLIATGSARHAYLGITSEDGTATVNGVTTSGAEVASVQAGSPAAGADLREGDVIIAMDSTNVISGESLVGLVRARKVSEQITLTLVRGGSQQQVKVTLAAAPR